MEFPEPTNEASLSTEAF